jgi:uncharacterized repeat protein (TIGR02543 family)
MRAGLFKLAISKEKEMRKNKISKERKMKKNKLGLLALIGLVAVASLFTVCKAAGANGNVYSTVFDQTIEVGYGQFRVLQPTEKKLLNILMPVDAEEPVALGEIALSDGEYILGIKHGEFSTDNYTVRVYDLNGDGDNNPATPVREKPEWPLGANQWAVNFVLDGGTLSGDNPKIVNDGESVSRPEPDPDKEGFTFEGWYNEEMLETLYNFASPVIANISVWAKWAAPRPMWTTFIYDDGNGDTTVSLRYDDAWESSTANARLEQLSTRDYDSIMVGGGYYYKEYILGITWGRDVDGATVCCDDFLYGFTALTDIDLSPLSGLTSVGNNFLDTCTGLTAVDLSPLSGLTSVANNFLSNCVQLQTLNLAPLSKVVSVGDSFLYSCEQLQTLNLAPLSGALSVGNNFLAICSGITSLDLTPLSGLDRINDGFLTFTGITSLDLAPLSGVLSIGDSFLGLCFSLEELSNLPALSNVGSIGNRFLNGCQELTSLDLSALPSTVTIGTEFLYNNRKMASVNMGAILYDKVEISNSFRNNGVPCVVTVNGDTVQWTNRFNEKSSEVVFQNEE